MNQQHWIVFAKDDGRRKLHNLFEAEVREIMGDISTSAQTKVVEIARQLMYMDRVKMDDSLSMDAEKPPAETEGAKEINHLDCTMDVAKIESLVDFPLVELGPECNTCDCFACSSLSDCRMIPGNHIMFCKDICRGTVGIGRCQFAKPWTLKEITKREG